MITMYLVYLLVFANLSAIYWAKRVDSQFLACVLAAFGVALVILDVIGRKAWKYIEIWNEMQEELAKKLVEVGNV
jgi:hypothetical protein